MFDIVCYLYICLKTEYLQFLWLKAVLVVQTPDFSFMA